MLAPELDPAAVWKGWPWEAEDAGAAGALAQLGSAQARRGSGVFPAPSALPPHQALRPTVRLLAEHSNQAAQQSTQS